MSIHLCERVRLSLSSCLSIRSSTRIWGTSSRSRVDLGPSNVGGVLNSYLRTVDSKEIFWYESVWGAFLSMLIQFFWESD